MIKFIRVNENYISTLRRVDFRVQSNSSLESKETKPFLGVLFTINEMDYYVPLSSPKEKHKYMPNSRDFHKVLDENGKLLCVLNFNNMVPVVNSLCSDIDFSLDKDRFLLQKEYEFCAFNEIILKNKAIKLYERYSKNLLTENEKARTCDFHKLENAMKKFLSNK